jgi:hypothetical protein
LKSALSSAKIVCNSGLATAFLVAGLCAGLFTVCAVALKVDIPSRDRKSRLCLADELINWISCGSGMGVAHSIYVGRKEKVPNLPDSPESLQLCTVES